MSGTHESGAEQGPAVAVIGMAGRFPGARDVAEFWSNLRGGVHSIRFFSDEELEKAGVSAALIRDPEYVKAGGVLDDIDQFDAAFFGFNPREAEVMDPQQRVFLETAWEAMENAGYDPISTEQTVGVYAGSSRSHYLQYHVFSRPDIVEAVGGFQVMLANSRDSLATRAAHKLNLRGPALNVQTGCSTGLVSIHVACQALLAGECDVALAGGVSISSSQGQGYRWSPSGIGSPDGTCRAFDARAGGTVGGYGVGVVVLRRLDEALADGDCIRAVIRGSAINNDGARKVGFTAPSVEGQSAVIEEALAVCGIDPETVDYVEAHGSGTDLGDPVEVAALTQAFGDVSRTQFCALGSVKTNIGHLDAAAGAAGLIKTTLALQHGEIPPSLHYTAPNPKIDFAGSPFFVNDRLRPWANDGTRPRRAGVSSFGIGGTNAHVVMEEAPAAAPSTPARPWHLLALSARTPAALEAATDRLAAHLRAHPEQALADVAWTLQAGRRAFEHRRVLVARDGGEAAAALEARAPELASAAASEGARQVAFLFPGLGSHYAGMGRGLYETEPVYREVVDRCAGLLRPHLGQDIRAVLYPAGTKGDDDGAAPRIDFRAMLGRAAAKPDEAAEVMNETRMAQVGLFVTEYALAQLWMAWGVRPDAMIGHSLGEYVAATVAGVWSLEDALMLVAERAKLIEEMPEGGMMGVALAEPELRPLLRDGLCVGTLNGPSVTVVSGPVPALEALQVEMESRGVVCRRLPARHAFHSAMMQPVAERLTALLRRVRMHAPKIPFVSNVTGSWIRPAEAVDPGYWARHLTGAVRFADGIETLTKDASRVLLEVGPGHALRSLVAQMPIPNDALPVMVASLRHDYERHPDVSHVLGAAGRLWAAGVAVDWTAMHAHERLRRVPLPTYPFERRRFWIDKGRRAIAPAAADPAARRADPAEWTYLPTWNRAPLPAAPAAPAPVGEWLVLADGAGIGTRLAGRLEALGHTVAVAEAGGGFARVGDRGYTVRPGSAADFAALRDALQAAGIRPRHVVSLWGIDDDAAEGAADGFARAQARGCETVAVLATIFGDEHAPPRIVVVTECVQDVAGGDPVRPERAAVLGACASAAVLCRTVDVQRRGGGAERLVDQLLAEVTAEAADTTVALRGPLRWTRGYTGVRTAGSAAPRHRGAYLFAGPLAAGGDAVVEHLVGAFGARIAVLVDPAFPEADGWDAALASPAGPTIRALRAAESQGARTLLLRAPLDDAAAVRRAMDEMRDAFGAVHGVVHTVAQAGPARVAGELAALQSAADGAAPDFVLLWTPMEALTGEMAAEAAAGCALADAWAQRRASEGARWTGVAWDRWHAAGDADAAGIGRAEGARAFERVLELAGEPRVVVCTADAGARIARGHAAPAAPAPRPAADAAMHARPEMATEFHAPTNDAEEVLAQVWRELLGIGQIGIHDDFFALGGHSLLGMQLISRVRDAFLIELPLRAIFEAPTISTLAAVIDDAILMELDEMSDEEALELIAGPVA